MTAMAAGLALIPLALGGGKAGSEIQTPMAIVILCGLMTSTLLNMFVVPTLYLWIRAPSVPLPTAATLALPRPDVRSAGHETMGRESDCDNRCGDGFA